jgi:hypothetical protein
MLADKKNIPAESPCIILNSCSSKKAIQGREKVVRIPKNKRLSLVDYDEIP